MLSKLRSHQIYLKMCALVNLKVLLLWSDFERIYYPLHYPFSWNHKKTIGFQWEWSFFMTITRKDSVLYFCQGSEYGSRYGCKILAKWLLKITGKHWHKECIVTKRIMPCLHIHVFISFSFLCLIFQARRQHFHFLHYILSHIL